MVMIIDPFKFPVYSGPTTTTIYRDHVGNSSNLTTYSWPSRTVGPAFANRFIVVGFVGQAAVAGRSSVSCTIGGVSATLLHEYAVGTSTTRIVSFYGATLNTGNTAALVITYSGAMTACGFTVWSVENYSAVRSTGQWIGTSGVASGPDSIFVQYGDSVCACVAALPPNIPSFTWTNLTERSDRFAESGQVAFSSADRNIDFSGALPISCKVTSTTAIVGAYIVLQPITE